MNLQEHIRKVLMEETLKDTMMREMVISGVKETAKLIGDEDNLLDVLDVKTPEDFLNLFNNMEVVKDKNDPNIKLYKKYGENVMVLNNISDILYVNLVILNIPRLWPRLSYWESKRMVKDWVNEMYNINEYYIVDFVRFDSEEFSYLRELN
jgi:hypothetical protein